MVIIILYWKLCGKYKLAWKDNWYERTPERVTKNEEVKLLWDMNIQCDHVIETRRPDLVQFEKKTNTHKI